MIGLLKEVGRGKRGARDLGLDEAREAARLVLHGEATPAQIGAFLVALRIKMESAEELQAFVEQLRSAVRESDSPGTVWADDGSTASSRLDSAGPHVGRKRTFFVSFPVAFLLAEAGMQVTLHGCRTLPPKLGVTLQDMFAERGIDAETLPLEAFARAARETGVYYAPAERLCPPLAKLRPIREQLGLRTVMNTAEKLVDFGRSPCLAMGIFHHTVVERIGLLLARLGYERAAIVQGMEGSEDVHIDRPTRMWLVTDGTVTAATVDPAAHGLQREVPQLDWTAETQMAMAERVLAGEAPDAFRDLAVLNAAYRMQVAGLTENLETGIKQAGAILASGKAFSRYKAWRAALVRN